MQGTGQPDEALAVATHSPVIAAETRSHRTTRQLYRTSDMLVTAGARDQAKHLRHTIRNTLR
jgi:hypothetical protein